MFQSDSLVHTDASTSSDNAINSAFCKQEFSSFARYSNGQTSVFEKVLVGAASTPATLQFRFENRQSMLLEKVIVSYRIKVTPPSKDLLLEGRRRRAKACLRIIEADLEILARKLDMKERYILGTEDDIAALQKEIDEKGKTIESISDEERRWQTLLQKLDSSAK